MTAIVWDDTGKRFYETGVDHGVLYPMVTGAYPLGVPWNGLINVNESPSGAEATSLWADNIKYLTLVSAEEFGLTIEAYTYPDEFAACDGSLESGTTGAFLAQQGRQLFGLSYRTKVGNDADGQDHGYKLHLVYGCLAAPSEKAYQSINDSPEAITFSWEVSTTPPVVTGFKPTSLIVVDSRQANAAKLAALELVLYGTVAIDPELPLPDEVITLLT